MVAAAKHIGRFASVKRDIPNLIVGLGKTGLSCARYLAARGEQFAVVDSRDQPPGLQDLRAIYPEVEVLSGGFDPMAFVRADRIILSPGVSLHEAPIAASQARGVEIIGDIELFARAVTAPVVAISGSNGKSTVTTLMGEMARAAGRDVRVGGNLGTPALDLLSDREPDLYVLELSSFQLETTHSLNAAAAVVLNLSSDHMDRYRDMEEYAAAKQRIYRGDGVMVLNADDALVMAMQQARRRCVCFGLEAHSEGDYGLITRNGQAWLARGADVLMALSELRIKGLHNAANALACLALGEAVGLPMSTMLDALRLFTGLAHRTQWVAERDGVTWYDDSKGTNVGATLAALHGMPGKVVLIAGGLGKGQDFTPLRAAAQAKSRAVVLLGKDAASIEAALAGVVEVRRAETMEEAVRLAHALAQPGDTVLLSPACASFDMFKGYDHRGQVYCEAVRGLLVC